MKPLNDLFEKITEDYSVLILNWAIKKIGNRTDGEDLAQEVLCRILSFVKKKDKIEKLDNLVWKIAHYTWCNRLRELKKDNNLISLDSPAGLYIIEERDYINEFSENEALKEEFAKLRRKISDLSKTQREIIIGYYLENLSVSDIAKKFNINKSAVKWHLFDARKNLKEKMKKMERFNKEDYYRKIIDYLNSHEEDIRNIGFYGCDFDWNKLLWAILTLYLRYFSKSEPLKTLKISDICDLHKDGGRYSINGFNQSDNQLLDLNTVISEPVFESEKWNKISGIWCGNISETTSVFKDVNNKPELATYWLGLYIFANNISALTKNDHQQKTWKKILANLLNNNFSASDISVEERDIYICQKSLRTEQV